MSTTRYALGIDPNGAVALLNCDEHLKFPPIIWEINHDMSMHDLYIIIGGCRVGENTIAYLEKLHAMKTSYVANWNLGRGYGQLEAMLAAHKTPFERVSPRRWQLEFGLWGKKNYESGTQKKKRHIVAARELFPSSDVKNHNIADALLIAEWGRRQRVALEGGVDAVV